MNQPTNNALFGDSRALALIIGGLIIFGLAFWFFILPLINPPEQRTFSDVDMSTTEGAERLPKGFPEDIPVDVNTIVRASSETHDFGNVEVKNVTFLSSQTNVELFKTYQTYLIATGYEISDLRNQGENIFITAKRGNETMLVSIMDESEETRRVFVTYSTNESES